MTTPTLLLLSALFLSVWVHWATAQEQYYNVAAERGLAYTNFSSLPLHYGRWEDYKVMEKAGKGKFSVVYRAIHLPTGDEVALKFLIYPVEYDRIQRELNVMQILADRANIITYRDLVKDRFGNSVVVMNYVNQGGSYKKLFETFNDWDIRHYLYQVLEGLSHMHSNGIIHRDLKPLNIVYDPHKMELNLCDLGTADFFFTDFNQKTKLGTKQYKSPEYILRKKDYDFKVDVWTVGVSMASMIFQMYPFFDSQDDIEQFMNICDLLGTPAMYRFLRKYNLYLSEAQREAIEEYELAPTPWKEFVNQENFELSSPDAWDLVTKLLAFDPVDRPSAEEALQHPYFQPIRECWSSLPVTEWPYTYTYEEETLFPEPAE